MRKLLQIFTLIIPLWYFAQLSVKVIDRTGTPVENAKIEYHAHRYVTNALGVVSIPLAQSTASIKISKNGFKAFTKKINPKPERQSLNILLQKVDHATTIDEVVFQRRVFEDTDQTSVEISAQQAMEIASVTGGIEDLLKTLPYVNSNTELSSQYMVRGGNYDENLIYINDVEIYRPFLIRNSQQEGMSIINPDMVADVSFSAGGFEARYGDKMSSVLNVYYRKPRKFELSGEASLIGGRLTIGAASKNQKFTALVSARYRNTNLLFNTLNEDTDFNPVYKDLQAYLTYRINKKWDLSFIGYWAQNDYTMIPNTKEVNFGTAFRPIKLSVGYAGQEDDFYRNMLGSLSLNFKPNKKWNFRLNTFAYHNREQEYFTIASAYLLEAFDPATGDPIATYDTGGQIDHARNDLKVQTYGAQFRTQYSPNPNTSFEVGVKFEREALEDFTNQWQLLDSIGYNSPRPYVPPGQLDPSKLVLKYHVSGQNKLEANRFSAYGQYAKKFYWGSNKVYINAGVRMQHWDYNGQTLISPRAQLAIKPNWDSDMLFKLSGGVYYQAPFYKEIKGLDGKFNPNIKAEKSYQLILSNDYEFRMADRPFKLTTELYYKYMTDLIPYYIDNVRTTYTGANNAVGYSYGIDARLFGEFVPGVDSWLSASYARSFQNIDGRGYIPRPTDQRLRLSLFYQDYMPKFPSMRINITAVYAMGLPNGAPIFQDPYLYQNRLPSYKRVDLGLSKVFIDEDENRPRRGSFWANFRELTLGVQVYNAFNIHNTVANQWVHGVGSQYYYAVPVYLTGRFFNVKLTFKL